MLKSCKPNPRTHKKIIHYGQSLSQNTREDPASILFGMTRAVKNIGVSGTLESRRVNRGGSEEFSENIYFNFPFPRRALPHHQEDCETRNGRKGEHHAVLGCTCRSSQSPSEDKPQPLPETQEQPVTLRRRGPKSNQSPLQEENPGTASHPQRKRIQEHPDTIGTRDFPCSLIQGRNGKTSMQKYIQQHKNKTSPESSPPPTPRPEHCNVDKAEENDLKNSLMKMIVEVLESKRKNAIKEIEEETNKKLEEMNKEIEEKNKKLEEMSKEIEEKINKTGGNKKLKEKTKKLEEMNNEIEEKTNKKLEEVNKKKVKERWTENWEK
ncbi:hypothetical protein STEG23_019715 [Scotinomys teguina]